jgi:hypothetical protein
MFYLLLMTGAGFGLVSALLYASPLSGVPLSLFLFLLSPLPLLIAGLGWSVYAALFGGALAAGTLSLLAGGQVGVGFACALLVPAATFSFLSAVVRFLQAKPSPSPFGVDVGETVRNNPVLSAELFASAPTSQIGSPKLLWLSLGVLILVLAVLAAFQVASAAFLMSAADFKTYTRLLSEVTEQMVRLQLGKSVDMGQMMGDNTALPKNIKLEDIVQTMVQVLPFIMGCIFTVVLIFNAWLAAKVVHFSGRLARSWRSMSSMRLPHQAVLLLLMSFILAWLPSFAGLFFQAFTGGLCIAFACHGLAVIHTRTRQLSWRLPLLGGIYLVILVLMIWILPLLVVYGLAELILSKYRPEQNSSSHFFN